MVEEKNFKLLNFGKNEVIVLNLFISSKEKNFKALEISKITGIHRSNTYDCLRSLIEKGIIYRLGEGNKCNQANKGKNISSRYFLCDIKTLNDNFERLKNILDGLKNELFIKNENKSKKEEEKEQLEKILILLKDFPMARKNVLKHIKKNGDLEI